MTLRQIKYFITIVEERSFTKAAAKLYVSQPALSKRMSEFEDELGCRLFSGNSRNLTVTDAGKLYYDYFVRASKDFEKCRRQVRKCSSPDEKVFTVACPSAWNTLKFLPRMQEICAAHFPGYQLRLTGIEFDRLLSVLESGGADITAAISTPHSTDNGYCAVPFARVPCTLLYSTAHTAAKKNCPSLLDFSGDTFFVPEPEAKSNTAPAMRQFTIDLCRSRGFDPRLERVGDVQTVLFNVQNNLGVTFYSDWYREQSARHFNYLSTGEYYTAYLVYLEKNSNSAAGEFARILSDEFMK